MQCLIAKIDFEAFLVASAIIADLLGPTAGPPGLTDVRHHIIDRESHVF
jgi:hypothetical protein